MLHVVIRSKRFSVLVLLVAIGAAVWAGCKTTKAPAATAAPATETTDLKPGPNDPKIAFITARLLESYHYLQHPFDRTMSVKAFDGYIDALDPRHENFLQSDLNEFSRIRTNLDLLIVGNGNKAELAPVFSIYQRFAERNIQHAAYVDDLLQHDKFKFATDEKIALDRRHDPFPKDMDEARQLWKQRLNYEYLIEKLAREIHETNGVFTVKLPPEATTNIIAAEAPNAIGFCGAIPYSKAATKRAAIRAARIPKAMPSIVSKILSRKTDLRTWPR